MPARQRTPSHTPTPNSDQCLSTATIAGLAQRLGLETYARLLYGSSRFGGFAPEPTPAVHILEPATTAIQLERRIHPKVERSPILPQIHASLPIRSPGWLVILSYG